MISDLPHLRTMMVSPVGIGLFNHQVCGAGRRSQGNDFGTEQHFEGDEKSQVQKMQILMHEEVLHEARRFTVCGP